MKPTLVIAFTAALLWPVPSAQADDAKLSFGGDQFSAGQTATLSEPAAKDAFVAGYDTSIDATVTGNAHLAGFSVKTNAAIGGDLYAIGNSVSVNGTVGGNITAAAATLALNDPSPIPGNVRLGGATVTLNTPVTGSALITAQTLTLNAPIAGDVRFFGESIIFGPAAKIDGQILIQAPKPIEVPTTVAAAERVRFEMTARDEPSVGAARTFENVASNARWANAGWLLLLALVGAAAIGVAPKGLVAMEQVATSRPLRTFGVGAIVLSAILGSVVVFGLTIVGAPVIPIVLLLVAIACSLGFLAGVYFIGLILVRTMVAIETKPRRIGVLVVALLLATLVGMIPFLGWLITLGLLCYGLGLAGVAYGGRSKAAALPADASPTGAAV